MNLTHIAAMLALAIGCQPALVAEETFIVNGGSATATLSADQVKDYFLGKKTSWEDGSKVVIVVVKDGSTNEALLARLGKNSQQFQTGWKKLVFTGKAAMPEQVDTDEAVVELVARTPGAIGFIDKGKLKDGVKAVAVQ